MPLPVALSPLSGISKQKMTRFPSRRRATRVCPIVITNTLLAGIMIRGYSVKFTSENRT